MLAVGNAADTTTESTPKEQKAPSVQPPPMPVPPPPTPRSTSRRTRYPSAPPLTSGDYTYFTNANGQATITGFNRSYTGELVITNNLAGCPVTAISRMASVGCTGITSVIIPASVTNLMASYSRPGITSLPSRAGILFTECRDIRSITVEASNPTYSSVDGILFNKDQTLLLSYPRGKEGSCRIPDGVTAVGNNSFAFCYSLTNVTIPNSATNIGIGAFYWCTNLVSVTIPNSAARIGSTAFYHCNSLTDVTIPATLTNISSTAFGDCAKLTNAFFTAYKKTPPMGQPPRPLSRPVFTCGDYGYFTNGTGQATIISFNRSHTGALVITNNLDGHPVTEITPMAFMNCTGLTSVIIPASLTNLGTLIGYRPSASRATNRTSSSVFSFPPFLQNTRLTAIDVDAANPNYSSVDGVLFNKDQSTLWQFPAGKTGSYQIPDTVTTILGNAFRNSSLTSVTIPGRVTSIGRSAFSSATKLANITIRDGVTEIAGMMFSGCTNLTSVSIPPSVTQIGDAAFYGCTNLTAVSIPADLTNISSSAFADCPKLTNAFFKAHSTAPPSRLVRPAPSAISLAERIANRQQTIERLKEMEKNSSDPDAKARLTSMISMLERSQAQDSGMPSGTNSPSSTERIAKRQQTIERLKEIQKNTTDPDAKARLASYIQMLERSQAVDTGTSSTRTR